MKKRGEQSLVVHQSWLLTRKEKRKEGKSSAGGNAVSVEAISLVRVDEGSVRRELNFIFIRLRGRRHIVHSGDHTSCWLYSTLSNPSQVKSITTACTYKYSPGRQCMWQKRKDVVFSHKRSTQLIWRLQFQKIPTHEHQDAILLFFVLPNVEINSFLFQSLHECAPHGCARC